MTVETCAHCCFDSRRWVARDVVNTVRTAGRRWEQYVEGLPDDLAGSRPDPPSPSIAALTQRAAVVMDITRTLVADAAPAPAADHAALDQTPALPTRDGIGGGPFPEPGRSDPDGPDRGRVDLGPVGLGAAVARLDEASEALFALVKVLPAARWDDVVDVAGPPWTVGTLLRHAVHDLSHHLGEVGRLRHRLGAGAPHQVGRVEAVHVSGGGVPKRPVPTAEVGWSGLAGDRQAARQHHGRPWQALCLWGTDVLATLVAEGHPIHAGAAGENLTVAGVDWATLHPGTRLRVGSVEAEISAYAVPCQKNARWFLGGRIDRMDHDRHPGSSRLYATVLTPGTVATGDPVVVEPPST